MLLGRGVLSRRAGNLAREHSRTPQQERTQAQGLSLLRCLASELNTREQAATPERINRSGIRFLFEPDKVTSPNTKPTKALVDLRAEVPLFVSKTPSPTYCESLTNMAQDR